MNPGQNKPEFLGVPEEEASKAVETPKPVAEPPELEKPQPTAKDPVYPIATSEPVETSVVAVTQKTLITPEQKSAKIAELSGQDVNSVSGAEAMSEGIANLQETEE